MKNVGHHIKTLTGLNVWTAAIDCDPLTKNNYKPRTMLKRYLEIYLKEGLVGPVHFDLIVKHIRHIDDL